MSATSQKKSFDPKIFKQALADSFKKLNPNDQIRNPVMFTVYVGSILGTLLTLQALMGKSNAAGPAAGDPAWFVAAITIALWFTVIFANFAESLAEGRGKAQANSLRAARQRLFAHRLSRPDPKAPTEQIPASDLQKGDLVLVENGQFIPADGEAVAGAAYVDESAVTGESAPVIRESGSDRSGVTGVSRVLSDWLIVKITAGAGENFLDRMINLVEGAKRRKTPNEIALSILLAALTLIFLLVCATLRPLSEYSAREAGGGQPISWIALLALFVCLAPTTIGGLLSAIGIAGMDRLLKVNVLAMSGRAVEASGDVDVLLLDKTGTITLGNRQAAEFVSAPGVAPDDLALAAQLASLADETPEGRSIVVLAKEKYGLRARSLEELKAHFLPFTAQTKMSGVDLEGRSIRKGAAEAVRAWVENQGGKFPREVQDVIASIAKQGGTPLAAAEGKRVLGVIHLKDIIKPGIRERFAELRRMGIKTIMITGDNALTAAAIAAEAGLDDFLAEATPEKKLQLIRSYQNEGRMVAMTGDGTNDAPALAQADVAVAMHTGTQAAKEAGNLVDLDSNPAKLIEIVKIGKQLLMTRGALTAFSITNDAAKYFAILPAAFAAAHPELGALNIMGLATAKSAVLSATIFNAIIIILLVPIALRGIRRPPAPAARLLRDNLLIYGAGGLITPFIGIKLIDLALAGLGLI